MTVELYEYETPELLLRAEQLDTKFCDLVNKIQLADPRSAEAFHLESQFTEVCREIDIVHTVTALREPVKCGTMFNEIPF